VNIICCNERNKLDIVREKQKRPQVSIKSNWHKGKIHLIGIGDSPITTPWSWTRTARSLNISFASPICSSMSLIPCSLSSIMASLNATSLSRSITSCLHVFVQGQESMKVVWIFQQKQQRCSFFPSLKKMNLQGVCQDFNENKKGGSQSGLRVASLHWYVKKRATQNTLQKKTHDYNPITKRKDKQQPNEYKHNHNRWKLTTITCSSFCTDSVTDLTLYTSTDLQIQLF